MNQPDRLKDIGDIIETSNLRLQKLLVKDLAVGDLLCRLLQRQDVFPRDEQANELLAEIAERLDFLVLGLLPLLARCGPSATLSLRQFLLFVGRFALLGAHGGVLERGHIVTIDVNHVEFGCNLLEHQALIGYIEAGLGFGIGDALASLQLSLLKIKRVNFRVDLNILD